MCPLFLLFYTKLELSHIPIQNEGGNYVRTIQSEMKRCGIANKEKEHQKKQKEKLSFREIEELMGKNRPTYYRVNGSFRSR